MSKLVLLVLALILVGSQGFFLTSFYFLTSLLLLFYTVRSLSHNNNNNNQFKKGACPVKLEEKCKCLNAIAAYYGRSPDTFVVNGGVDAVYHYEVNIK